MQGPESKDERKFNAHYLASHKNAKMRKRIKGLTKCLLRNGEDVSDIQKIIRWVSKCIIKMSSLKFGQKEVVSKMLYLNTTITQLIQCHLMLLRYRSGCFMI